MPSRGKRPGKDVIIGREKSRQQGQTDGWMGEREDCMKEGPKSGGRESERDRKERVGRSSDFLAEARD